jgi:hypothetical protein
MLAINLRDDRGDSCLKSQRGLPACAIGMTVLDVFGRQDAMDYLCYTKRVAEHCEQMDAMMAQQGVDRATAQGVDGQLGWITARAKCIFCKQLDVCGKWLAGEVPHVEPADFCPNTTFFEECRVSDPIA